MRSKAILARLVLAALLIGLPMAAAAQVAVDPALKPYQPVQGVSGSLKSVGSDSMNNEMTLWAEGYLRHYPNVRIEIEGKGSSTAPPALIAGTAQFGPMSREMKAQEIDDFTKKYGYPPLGLPTSIDMLAIYVHKDNPIAQRGLTLQQVDAIFSVNRKDGYDRDIRTWGDVGLTGEWAGRPISLYGRNAASGTYGFVKEVVLKNGDYKPSVKEQPGSSSVVQGVASDRYGMGYSGIGYMTADVKAVPLAATPTGKMIPALPENAYTGEYPLARFLFVYVNHRPGSRMDPLRAEFLKYVFSRDGQQDVVKDGYYPLPATIVNETLAKLGLR